MIRIGITGQNGFVGSHLFNTLGLHPDKYDRVDFKRDYFGNNDKLDAFVKRCDVIVHLAAINRHESEDVLYHTNLDLSAKLVESMNRTGVKPHVIISSSTQEDRENNYGNSKKIAREILANWAENTNSPFTGLIIPNVFGPFGKPFYNSVVATFSHQIANNQQPQIQIDGSLKLIYVAELVNEILQAIESQTNNREKVVKHTKEIKVSEILEKLQSFQKQYAQNGSIPELPTEFDLNLFNTYRCYIDHLNHFPVKLKKNTDDRGSFIEIIRLGIGGQVSYSTTNEGITRGNHFHTRKIERFTVIQGKAKIQLRKINTDEILDFYLDGENPSYVDMPIWYTHNITNIGDSELLTIFWINEPYNPIDPDTFLEVV